LIITIIITLQPLYRTTCIGHHLTVKNWRILLEQSFTVSMSLLTATYYQIIYSLQSHFHWKVTTSRTATENAKPCQRKRILCRRKSCVRLL